ncbi:MAG TPA: putative zinc-binding protein, partial [Paludibacter sp.]|nr:putative zinc-binding protein [Paludibacter sp.]
DNKVRKMNCLSMIAIDSQPLITAFKSANVLVIDGCPVDCGKKILEKAGITDFNHLRLTDIGYKKGETPISENVIQAIYEKAEAIH